MAVRTAHRWPRTMNHQYDAQHDEGQQKGEQDDHDHLCRKALKHLLVHENHFGCEATDFSITRACAKLTTALFRREHIRHDGVCVFRPTTVGRAGRLSQTRGSKQRQSSNTFPLLAGLFGTMELPADFSATYLSGRDLAPSPSDPLP